MTLKTRSITDGESQVLDRWQWGDNAVAYRRARTLRLSAAGWGCAAIAEALGQHVETVRQTIKNYNKGGIDSVAPRPRSGGR